MTPNVLAISSLQSESVGSSHAEKLVEVTAPTESPPEAVDQKERSQVIQGTFCERSGTT